VAGGVGYRSGRGAGLDPAARRAAGGGRYGRVALPRTGIGQSGPTHVRQGQAGRRGRIPGDRTRRPDRDGPGRWHGRADAQGGVAAALAVPRSAPAGGHRL
jgi:hypothetical protein